MTKYLKIWTDTITNSFAGRDEGQLIERMRVFDSMEDLAKTYDKHAEEKYFMLKSVDENELKNKAREAIESEKLAKRRKKANEIEDKISKLKGELKALEVDEDKEGISTAKIGDRVRVIRMKNEVNLDGKEGIVKAVDSDGRLHGTWGHLSIIPEHDDFVIIKDKNDDLSCNCHK